MRHEQKGIVPSKAVRRSEFRLLIRVRPFSEDRDSVPAGRPRPSSKTRKGDGYGLLEAGRLMRRRIR